MTKAKLSADQLPIADGALATRLFEKPSTAAELVAAADRALGHPEGDPCYRYTDLWLQRLRRRGFATPTRSGQRTFWGYTPAGFDTLNAMVKAGERARALSDLAALDGEHL